MAEAGSGLLRARRWDGLDGEAREALLDRGLDRIFDPALLEEVGRRVEDVAERGDAAVAEALAEFDGVEVTSDSLPVAPE
ncbi:MAG: hypothetical protein ACKOQ5_07830, partial [Solirubrobacterales bacterium]